jgi:hypothetical protein
MLGLAFNTVALADRLETGQVLKAGARDYRNLCASCHEVAGKGDGAIAAGLKVRPPDLTEITKRNGGVSYPDTLVWGAISGLEMPIAHGTRDMPIWGRVFVRKALDKFGDLPSREDAKEAGAEVNTRIRRLVKYIESIQVSK